MSRTALVAGPTGLIGSLLLRRLLADPAYTEVRVLSRRPLREHDPKLQVIVSDYHDLQSHIAQLAVDDVFCCLGTTRRKAGSRAAFEDVDLRMVVELAQTCRLAGARQFLVVSAVGASAQSLAFYSRVKGRMEAEVAALDFEAVHLLRPSLLLGARQERRPAEALGQIIAPLLVPLLSGPLARYRPVDADDVAAAMHQLALSERPGIQRHHLPLRGVAERP